MLICLSFPLAPRLVTVTQEFFRFIFLQLTYAKGKKAEKNTPFIIHKGV